MVGEQVKIEFPETTDFDRIRLQDIQKSNGWPYFKQAISLYQTIEDREKARDELAKDLNRGRMGFMETLHSFVNDDQRNHASYKRFLLATNPVLVPLREAAKFDTIAHTDTSCLRYGSYRTVWLILLRCEMLVVIGKFIQAEDEYKLGLELAKSCKPDKSLAGLMYLHGIRAIAAKPQWLGSSESSNRGLKLLLAFLQNIDSDPADNVLNELASEYALRTGLQNKSLSEILNQQRENNELWDTTESFLSRNNWLGIAEEFEERLAYYKTLLDVSIRLRDDPPNYMDLSAIHELSPLYSKLPMLKPVLFEPISNVLRLLHVRLAELELEGGSLLNNRLAVETLVKKTLPQYRVIWDETADDSFDAYWDDKMQFKVLARPEFLKSFNKNMPPELLYEPFRPAFTESTE
ncbi:MAG: hypothetical protein V3V10_09785 [Planctomycetota bacterium]